MSKTFKVQFMQEGELKKFPAASPGYLTTVLRMIKLGLIDKLEIERKEPLNDKQEIVDKFPPYM